jgi:peroxiredoxin
MNPDLHIAPELQISQWLNTPAPINLRQLRGRLVVLHAFQMLCPGCVAHGLPQATLIRETFSENDVAVIGLHTVFEHHAVMNADALRAFVHEYRLSFPIGIDMPSERGGIPKTMSAYGLRGTPSLVLIDRDGIVRLNHFGRIDDMRVGAIIGQLVAQPGGQSVAAGSRQTTGAASCGIDGCD